MANNTNLQKAKDVKNDEFYTQFTDISKELIHYKEHFKDKIVYCNCDDPTWSAFWKYFHLNFKKLNLKKLISTHYNSIGFTYKMIYDGGNDNDIKTGTKILLEGNGDFRSKECLECLDESDIVVTNPPFSLAREYIACLVKYNKLFLCIGDLNWITYREIFPLLKDNKIWLGNCSVKGFLQPDGTIKKFGNKLWFTNLDHKKRHEKIILSKIYSENNYPKYDNYNVIEVGKTTDIPIDYMGIMGVPITYLGKHNSDDFEIIGFANGNFKSNSSDKLKAEVSYIAGLKDKGGCPLINGKLIYPRILIRRK